MTPDDADDADDADGDWAWFEAERLHRAAHDGDLAEMARLAADGHDLHAYDDMERTPLHHAAEAGQCEAVAWLLARGADVNANDEDKIGETPVSLAVQKTHPEMVELLLRHGADPDIPGWMWITARDRALERKRPAGVRVQALIARYAPTVKPRR